MGFVAGLAELTGACVAIGLLWGLLNGLFAKRYPQLVRRRVLARAEAPAFFSMVDDIARRTRVRPPTRIELSPCSPVAIADEGGLFGIGSNRTMAVGLSHFALLQTDEMRALVAGAFGRLAGGGEFLERTLHFFSRTVDGVRRRTSPREGFWLTRWFGLARWVTERAGRALVKAAWRYSATVSRSSEVALLRAADLWSIELVGSEATKGAITRGRDVVRYWDLFREQLGDLAELGAMPIDLLESLRLLGTQALPPYEYDFETPFEASKKDTWLAGRLGVLEGGTSEAHAADARSALDFVAALLPELDEWIAPSLEASTSDLVRAPLAELPANVLAPALRARADAFARTMRDDFSGWTTLRDLLLQVAVWMPATPSTARGRSPERVRNVVERLLEGALLECGAHLEITIEGFAFLWREERVIPARIAREVALTDDISAVRALAERMATV